MLFRLLALFLTFALVLPPSVLAQVSLDLSSTQRTVAPPAQSQPVTLNVGGTSRTIGVNDMLTPAENIALQQILSTGTQSIQLNGQGGAIGGTLRLDGLLGQQLANLVIPNGVTAIHNFASQSALNLTGNLTNSGNLYALSTSSAVTNAIINASNIYNQSGAVLSSVLPSAGLPGFTNTVSHLNLTLNAIHDIVNAGVIASSGNLNLNAGGSIINALPAGVVGPSPVMQAVNNLNLTSAIGSITNAGTLASLTGNINIASQMHDLIVNNINGRMQAGIGNINFGSPDVAGKVNLSIVGGDFISKQLNAFSGNGVANLNVQKLLGTLNISAGEAHVQAETPDLVLGSINLTGDPTFYNTVGNVVLTSSLTLPGQPLAIVAGRDILTSGTGIGISTGNSSGNGGNILLVAGALFTSSGASQAQPPTGSSSTLTISGASSNGGSIKLSGINSLTSASTGAGNGNGGTLTAVAFSGSDPASGVISLPSSVGITTGGKGTGTGGDVTFIAGANSGSAISTGSINVTGGALGAGKIALYAATPTVTGGSAVISSDVLSSGGFSNGTKVNGSISTGNLTVPAATTVGSTAITVSTGGNALLGSVSASSTSTTGRGGNISITTGSSTAFDIGTATVNGTTGPISASPGSNNGSGGVISVSNTGSGGITTSNLGYLTAASTSISGDGGSITLDAGSGVLTMPVGTISVNAAGSGNGGSVTLTGSSISLQGTGTLTLNADAAGTGNGGSLSITTTSATSDLTLGTADKNFLLFARGGSAGSASGNGGSITLSAGRNLTANAGSASPLGTNGGGAIISVAAGTATNANLLLNGTLSVDAVGTGNAGSITIAVNSSTPFLIGGATTNGSVGGLSADAVSSANSGDAGSITVTNSGTGGITVGNIANLSASSSKVGDGGSISLYSPNGTLTLQNGTISVKPTSGKGGNVTLDGLSVVANGGKLAIDVSGTGSTAATGVAGSLSITSRSSTADLTIGSASGNFDITANNGGNGDGATFNFSSGRNLTINSSNLRDTVSGDGKGATLNATAGTGASGNLFINGAFNVNGHGTGGGGTMNLISNGSTALTLGNNTGHGATGTLRADAGATGSGGSITVKNLGTGGVTFTNVATNISVDAASSGAGGSINVDAGSGTLTMPGGTMVAKAVGSTSTNTGGSIKLKAATLSLTGSGAVVLDASAPTLGQGGTVDVQTTGATSDITVGTTTGTLKLVANGGAAGSSAGNGGILKVTAGRNLTVAPAGLVGAPLGTNGTGVNLTLAAGGALSISAALSANGNGTGSGGSITLSSNSSTAFNLGGGGTNGITGALTANAGATSGGGGSISVTNTNGGITWGTLSNVSMTTAAGGGQGGSLTLIASGTLTMPTGTITLNGVNGNFNGGSVTLQGSSLSVTGSALTLNADASGTGDGGSISITTTGSTSDLTVGSGQLVLNARGGSTSSSTGKGGSVTLLSGRNLTVNTGSLTLGPRGTNGDGGALTLRSGSSGTLSVTGTLSANAVGTGNGGSVTVTTLGTSADIGVGSGAGEFAISATGVNPGSVTLTSGRNLTINSSSLTLTGSGSNANGATLALTAGSALKVTGNLSTSAVGNGNAGALTLTYNDATNPFVVGSTVSNSGVSGNITAAAPGTGTGGTITINNSATGALSVSLAGTLSADSTSGTRGTVNLNKTGQLVQLQGAGTFGGNLNASGSSVNVSLTAPSLTLQLGTVSSSSGNVSITANGTGSSIRVRNAGSISSAGNVSLFTNSLNNRSTISATGTNASISVQGTTLTVDGIGTYLANVSGTPSISFTSTSGDLTLGSSNLYTVGGTGGVSFQSPTAINFTNATTQLVTSGTVSLTAPVLVTPNLAAISTSGGAISIAPGTGNSVTFSGSGTLSLLGGSTTATVSTGGTITVNSGVTLSSDKVFTLRSDNIVNNGTLTSPSGTLSGTNYYYLLANGGNLTVTGTGTLGIGALAESANGTVSLTQGTLNTISSYNSRGFTAVGGSPSLWDIQTQSGSISVTASTGNLNVLQGRTLSAPIGDITLVVSDTVNGSIFVNQDVTMTASSSSTKGNIYITIGPVPSNPVANTPPTNMTVNASNGGLAYWGNNNITSNLKGATGNTVNVNGSDVVFNTGTRSASAITLDGNVVLNATGNKGIIDSLDFTNPAVVARIIALQARGLVGGTLQTSGGIATGGNAIFSATNFLSPSNPEYAALTAENIPVNVTATFNSLANPLAFSLTSGSTTKQVLISGTHQFIGGTNTIDITASASLTGPAFVVNTGGLLSSNGTLSVNADTMRNTGTVTGITVNFTGSTDLNFGGTGTVNATTTNFTASNGILGFVRSTQTMSGAANLTANNISIDTLSTISTTGNLSLVTPAALINGTLLVNGNNNTLSISNDGGLSITGLPQRIANLGTNGAITLAATGNTLTINSTNFKVDPGATGTLNLQGNTTALSSVTTLTVDSGAAVRFFSPAVTFGNGSSLSASGASAISFAPSTASNVTITAPSGSSATVKTTGGTISFSPQSGNSLSFNSSSTGSTTLFLTGGAVTATTTNSSTTVGTGVTLSENTSLLFNVDNGTFTNNGTLTSSIAAGSLAVRSTGNLTLAGNARYTPGASGTLTFSSTGAAGTVTFDTNTTQTLTNGSLRVSAPNVALSAGSLITATGASAITLDTGTLDTAFGVSLPSNGSAAINTTGGTITFSPLTGRSLSFSRGSGTGTLNLSGGAVTMTTNNADVIIGTGVAITSTGIVTVNANNGALSNSGTLASGNGVAGQITVQSTGTLNITNPGNLSVSASSGSSNGGTVIITSTGALTLGSGNLFANASTSGNGGKITITAPSISIPSGVLALQTNAAGNGNGGTITVSANGATSDLLMGNGGASFTVSAAGAGSGTGGTVQVTAGRNLSSNSSISALGSLTLTSGAGAAGNLAVSGSLSADTLTLSYNNTNPFVVGAAVLNSSVSGNITATTLKISNTAASPLAVTNSGTISASTINLTASNQDVTVVSTGSLNGAVTLNGNTVSLTAANLTGSLSGIAANSFTATVTSGGLTLGDTSAMNGSLTATVAGGTLNVAAGKTLYATEGDITLLNTDTLFGSISIGTGATLMSSTTGTTLGQILVAIGSVPATPDPGSLPSNFTQTLTNGGTIFYGVRGITSNAPTNVAKVNQGRIVFSTGALDPGAITLNGNVNLYSYRNIPLLTSLDLSNGTNAAALKALQTAGRLGGSLTLNGSNVATGGDIILLPFNYRNAISSISVPANVTVTNEAFHPNNAINVSITAASTTKQVLVNGTFRFLSANNPSNGIINVTTNQANVPLQINSTGTMTTDGTLTANVGGAITLNGVVTGGTLNFSTTTGNNAISYGANLTATSAINLTTAGSGQVTRTNGTLTAPLLTLTSTTGNLGTNGTNLVTAVGTLRATTGGAGTVFINNTGAIALGDASVGGTYQVTSSSDLTASGKLSAGTLILKTTGAANVIVSGTSTASGAVTLNPTGTGSVIVNAGGIVQSTANTITVQANDLDLQGNLLTSTSTILIKPNTSRAITVGGTGSGNGTTLDISAAELGRISAKTTLTLGDTTTTSGLTVVGNLDLTNATHNLALQTAGNYVATGTSAILGGRNLTVTALGSANTGGIASGTGQAVFTSKATTTVDGTITMSGGLVRFEGPAMAINSDVTSPSITIRPGVANTAMAVGTTAGGAPLLITPSMLGHLFGPVTIGDQATVPTLTITSDFTLPSSVSRLTVFATNYVGTGHTITMDTQTLQVNVSGTIATGSITANKASVSFVSTGALTLDGSISLAAGSSSGLTTQAGSNSNIILNGSMSGGDYGIKADGSILWQSGTISGKNVGWTATNGSIGSHSSPVRTNSTNATLLTSTTGSAYLLETDDITMGSSSVGGEMEITAGGTIALNRLVSKNGSITVHAGTGIGLFSSQAINANEGNVVLQADTGFINIGTNATILAYTAANPSFGNVTLAVGQIPGSPVAGTSPANFILNTQDGGAIYFGTNGITSNARANTGVAIARNIIFSTGSSPSTAIVLGGGVTITADPPVSPLSISETPPADNLGSFGQISPDAPTSDPPGSTGPQPTLDPIQSVSFPTDNSGGGTPGGPTYTGPLTVVAVTPSEGGSSLVTPTPPVDPKPPVLPSVASVVAQDVISAKTFDVDETNIASLIPVSLTTSTVIPLDTNDSRTSGHKSEPTLKIVQTSAGAFQHLGDADIVEEKPGIISLRNGETMIHAMTNTVVHCGEHSITVAPGTVAVIRTHNGVTTVSNLYEKNPNSVHVALLIDGKFVPVGAGEEICIGPTDAEVRDAISQDQVARRELEPMTLASGQKLLKSEISLVSLMNNSKLLTALQKSNSPNDKQVANHIMKMAACLLMVTSKRGPYSQKPQ